MTRSYYIRTAPIPLPEASLSMKKALEKSGVAKTGVAVMACFEFLFYWFCLMKKFFSQHCYQSVCYFPIIFDKFAVMPYKSQKSSKVFLCLRIRTLSLNFNFVRTHFDTISRINMFQIFSFLGTKRTFGLLGTKLMLGY